MKTITYTETAYDSTRPRDLPPLDETRLSASERAIRRWPLKGRGVQCREFLPGTFAHFGVSDFQEMDEEEIRRIQEEGLERNKVANVKWGSLRNPALIVDAIGKVAIFFAFAGGGFGSLLLLFKFGFDQAVLETFLVFFPPPLALYYLCKTAVARGWVKDRHNTVFERRTGMVEFTLKGRRMRLPFDEFDPYISEGVGRSGYAHYYLRLVHRYSPVQVTNPYARDAPWEIERDWEELLQTMDVSKPLPDIPIWELARDLDPTTLEYDRRMGRPARFWKQQDPEEVRSWADASREALKRYPWGLTREEALAVGWEPSGCGEGEAIWLRPAGQPREATPTESEAGAA